MGGTFDNFVQRPKYLDGSIHVSSSSMEVKISDGQMPGHECKW